MTEGFSADAAAKGSCSTVRTPHMDLEAMRSWEHLDKISGMEMILTVNMQDDFDNQLTFFCFTS